MPRQQGLTVRQRRFVAQFGQDLNATQAAIRAGYTPTNARQAGAVLLSNPNIRDALATHEQAVMNRLAVTEARVVQEAARIAFANPIDMFGPDNTVQPFHEWPEDLQRAVASVEVVVKNAEAGDGHTDRALKVRFWDKTKAPEMLMRRAGLFQDKVKIEHTYQQLEQIIGQARQRWQDDQARQAALTGEVVPDGSPGGDR